MKAEKRHKVLSAIGLPSVTEQPITRMDWLEEELKGIMEAGYAFEDQELRTGVRRVLAPIYDSRNRLAGCVGAAAIFNLEINDIEGLDRQILKTAQQISNRMGNPE